jgi:hypothetical protein
MKIKKVILLVFGILLSPTLILAQTLGLPSIIQSPNASSLGKYGDVPVDLNNGRADVNIPLYSVEEGGIPLDISLNYDTGGVRVNDVPGWVGQNWSLNAGGVITRMQKGIDIDERKTYNSFLTNPYTPTGFMYYKQDLGVNLNNVGYLKTLIENSNTLAGRKDYEPDVFFFNFLGFAGKFFLGIDGEWKVISSQNLRIEIKESDFVQPLKIAKFGNGIQYPGNRRSKVIGKIKIYDDKGNYYVFGGTENAQEGIEYSFKSIDNQSFYDMASTAWYLFEVYNSQDQKIYNFEYERGSDQAALYLTAGYKVYKRDQCGSFFTSCPYVNQVGDAALKLGGTLIKPVFLKKITTKGGITLDFSSENANLSNYYDPTNIYISRYITKMSNMLNIPSAPEASWYNFNYHYWYSTHLPINNGDTTTENPTYVTGDYYTSVKKVFDEWKWRKLTKIQIKNNSNIIKAISFTYNNLLSQRLNLQNLNIDQKFKYTFEYDRFEQLPQLLSKSYDHFGYYNGKDYNDYPINENEYYNNRNTDSQKVSIGVLNKIIYPLGGYTVFEYEPHSYSAVVSENRNNLSSESGIIGGLRIKRIKDVSDNKTIIKEYLYQKSITNTASSGNLLLKNKYYVSDWVGSTICGSNFYMISFDTNSMVPLANFSGGHIEYSNVIEKSVDVNGVSLGYTTYNYTSYNDFKDYFEGSVQPNFALFDNYTDLSFKRGKLLSKEVFDNNNTIKYKEEYSYNDFSQKKSPGLSFDRFANCNADGNYSIKGTAYNIFYSDYKPILKKTKTFGAGGSFVENIENYNFIEREGFGDNFLKSKTSINSIGNIISENYNYSFDKIGTEPYTTLTNKRQYSVIEVTKLSNQEILSKSRTDYASVPTVDTNGNPVSSKVFPQKYLEAKGNNSLEEKLVIDKYDIDGNIVKVHQNNGTYIYYYYGYNNKLPILKIEGIEIADESIILNQINTLKPLLTVLSPDYTQIKQIQINIMNSLPNHLCTLYTYGPHFKVTSIRNSSGIVEYYNYDNIGRLINIKDQEGRLLRSIDYKIKN